jgi:hypothetical protein
MGVKGFMIARGHTRRTLESVEALFQRDDFLSFSAYCFPHDSIGPSTLQNPEEG